MGLHFGSWGDCAALCDHGRREHDNRPLHARAADDIRVLAGRWRRVEVERGSNKYSGGSGTGGNIFTDDGFPNGTGSHEACCCRDATRRRRNSTDCADDAPCRIAAGRPEAADSPSDAVGCERTSNSERGGSTAWGLPLLFPATSPCARR